MGKEVSILPNPDLPVSITFNKESINAGEELLAEYSIDGCASFTGTASWTIGEKRDFYDEYSQDLDQKNITTPSGTVSYSPAFGDYMYLVLKGQDENNRFVYIESPLIQINSSEIEEITASFSVSAEYAEIGQPFEINYMLNGGSGEFSDVTIQVLFPLGSGTSYGGFSKKINSKTGSCTIVPEEGKNLNIQIYGYDSRGRQFYIDMGKEIPILPNPDLPVEVSFLAEKVAYGERIISEYNIGNCQSFSGTVTWTVGEIGEYWDKYSQGLNEQGITKETGAIEYTPTFGDYAYFVLRGQDEKGRFVYIESNRIELNDSAYPPNTLFLPEELTSINSKAFEGVSAEYVSVPSGVSFIADDAFSNSNVKCLYGSTPYVENYAASHGFDYVQTEQ